jgi:hypothetical protein
LIRLAYILAPLNAKKKKRKKKEREKILDEETFEHEQSSLS